MATRFRKIGSAREKVILDTSDLEGISAAAQEVQDACDEDNLLESLLSLFAFFEGGRFSSAATSYLFDRAKTVKRQAEDQEDFADDLLKNMYKNDYDLVEVEYRFNVIQIEDPDGNKYGKPYREVRGLPKIIRIHTSDSGWERL